MSSLSLKTVVVHKSVTSVMMEANLRKGGLVHRVPCTKSREKLQELYFRVHSCCFVNIDTVTYFNLFLCPFEQRDMSVMTETNLQKGGLVRWVPCTKSREKLQELFQSVL